MTIFNVGQKALNDPQSRAAERRSLRNYPGYVRLIVAILSFGGVPRSSSEVVHE